MQKFTVGFEYPVFFTTEVFHPSNPTLANAVSRTEPETCHRLYVVIDEGVARVWPNLCQNLWDYAKAYDSILDLVAEPEIVEGGEQVKNDPSVPHRLQANLHTIGIDRQSVIVGIGGGALLDMVGYVAATTHRGVRIIRLPTTVLSQADGGVGVKNGMNAFGTKNFLGTFSPPFAVINDIRFIETLESRDKIAGMAEAVKVAIIRDVDFFYWIATHADDLSALEHTALAGLIRRCAELHLDHIAQSGDPFEFGRARPLDFGHWAAHKLETLSDYRLRHGEAVAIGLAIDARYSVEVGAFEEESFESIYDLLSRLGLPLWDPVLTRSMTEGYAEMLDGLEEFRQHLGGRLTLMILQGIGEAVQTHQIDRAAMIRAFDWLHDRHTCR